MSRPPLISRPQWTGSRSGRTTYGSSEAASPSAESARPRARPVPAVSGGRRDRLTTSSRGLGCVCLIAGSGRRRNPKLIDASCARTCAHPPAGQSRRSHTRSAVRRRTIRRPTERSLSDPAAARVLYATQALAMSSAAQGKHRRRDGSGSGRLCPGAVVSRCSPTDRKAAAIAWKAQSPCRTATCVGRQPLVDAEPAPGPPIVSESGSVGVLDHGAQAPGAP